MYPDFVGSYVSWLKSKISVKDFKDYLEITTPFLDRHNDHMQIFVKKVGDKFILTDDGYTINELVMSGVDLTSHKRQDTLNTMLNRYNVKLINDEILTETNSANFPQRKHSLIQAMLAVDDMFLVAQQRIKGFFLEDVESFFASNDIRFISDLQLTGKSGFSHSFDFAIPASKLKPERLIKAVNNPTREKTESIIFAWDDTRETRKKESMMYVFLNDDEKKIRSDIIGALKEYSITPILWSNRQNYKNDLVA
jgi:DNA polymerase elongation subunit (family B)